MATNHSESLVRGAPAEGVVEIRKSAIIALLLVVALFAGLVLWLMHSTHPAIAAPSPQNLGALHGSDVSALDQNATKRTDALPTAPAAAPRALATPSALDPSLLAQPQPQFAQTAQAPMPNTNVSDVATSRAEEAVRLRRQQIDNARSSEMDLKLGDRDDRRARPDALPPAAATQSVVAQTEVAAAPSGPIVQRGMIIPTELYTPIDSTVPGVITAQVRQDVFDATHRVLVIPRGSKLVGSYASAMAQGQARLFVSFDSIKLPNLQTIDLGAMRGVDLNGVAGLGGTVDFHTGRLFGNVLLLSVLAAGAQLAQPRVNGCAFSGCQESAGQAIGSAVGSNVANAATQTYDRTLYQPPTMHVPAGYILNVMVERDLPLSAYRE
jgi:type IV secretory pathway VirB10-like protein